jgi:uncharacterized protein YjbI with pentapeptide repeats
VNLSDANLKFAHLEHADLNGANLSGTKLNPAFLEAAELHSVCLREADISGALLNEARHLTQGQVNDATGDFQTRLPQDLCMPRNWHDVTADWPWACPAPK